MPDTFTPAERSAIMRAVKGKDTALERRVRSALWRMGLRFRKNLSALPGKPDIVFTKRRVAVFIDSCFWHGCPDHLRRPRSNEEYWVAKIAGNQGRDEAANAALQEMGWTIVRLWEHELRCNFEECLRRVLVALAQREPATCSHARGELERVCEA